MLLVFNSDPLMAGVGASQKMRVVPCDCTWKVGINDFLARRGGGAILFLPLWLSQG